MKFQIPNHKLQINFNDQNTNSKLAISKRHEKEFVRSLIFVFVIYLLFDDYYLAFDYQIVWRQKCLHKWFSLI
ncbi:MAG TPA: hypothetical protein VGD14_01710, partial [bacterium]